jgi:osmotically-inducible protein OsmY
MAGPALAQKSAGEHVDDSWLHTKVKGALVGYGSSGINLEVYHGIVQMAGFVKSETEKKAAEDQAWSVEGVKEIRNRLVVQTEKRSAGTTLDDGVVAGRVKSALSDDDRTSGFSINVEVRSGVVLISGFVSDYGEGQIAEEVTRNVEGVEDVINGTDVPPEES